MSDNDHIIPGDEPDRDEQASDWDDPKNDWSDPRNHWDDGEPDAEKREPDPEDSLKGLTPEERDAVNPEPPPPRKGEIPNFPDLKDWGGIRQVKRQLRRSFTIMENREAIAYELLCMAQANIKDFCRWNEEGQVRFVPSAKLDHRHARMIKKITSRTTVTGAGENKSVTTNVEVELFDKVQVLRLLAAAAGLLARDTEDDKPAIIGMRVVGPRKRRGVHTIEQKAKRKAA